MGSSGPLQTDKGCLFVCLFVMFCLYFGKPTEPHRAESQKEQDLTCVPLKMGLGGL